MAFAIVAMLISILVERLNHNSQLKEERRSQSDIKAMFRKSKRSRK